MIESCLLHFLLNSVSTCFGFGLTGLPYFIAPGLASLAARRVSTANCHSTQTRTRSLHPVTVYGTTRDGIIRQLSPNAVMTRALADHQSMEKMLQGVWLCPRLGNIWNEWQLDSWPVFENTYFMFFFQISKKHDFLRFFEMTYQKVVKSL